MKNIDKYEYEDHQKIVPLLIDEVVFLDSSEDDKTLILVNCNDVFMWAHSDYEYISYDEIDTLYDMYKQNRLWGAAVWCIQKRGILPQKPVHDKIQELGIWNLDEMNLSQNPSWK